MTEMRALDVDEFEAFSAGARLALEEFRREREREEGCWHRALEWEEFKEFQLEALQAFEEFRLAREEREREPRLELSLETIIEEDSMAYDHEGWPCLWCEREPCCCEATQPDEEFEAWLLGDGDEIEAWLDEQPLGTLNPLSDECGPTPKAWIRNLRSRLARLIKRINGQK